MVEVGKKYIVSNLYKIRKFYEVFSEEKLYPLGKKLTTMWSKLSWSHYLVDFFDLDVILAVGYRVNSRKDIMF